MFRVLFCWWNRFFFCYSFVRRWMRNYFVISDFQTKKIILRYGSVKRNTMKMFYLVAFLKLRNLIFIFRCGVFLPIFKPNGQNLFFRIIFQIALERLIQNNSPLRLMFLIVISHNFFFWLTFSYHRYSKKICNWGRG